MPTMELMSNQTIVFKAGLWVNATRTSQQSHDIL